MEFAEHWYKILHFALEHNKLDIGKCNKMNILELFSSITIFSSKKTNLFVVEVVLKYL